MLILSTIRGIWHVCMYACILQINHFLTGVGWVGWGVGGGGLLSHLFRFVIFRIFSIVKTHIRYRISRWYWFGRCRRSSAAVTPVKCKCVSRNRFCHIENFAYGEINERSLSTKANVLYSTCVRGTLVSIHIFLQSKLHLSFSNNPLPLITTYSV